MPCSVNVIEWEWQKVEQLSGLLCKIIHLEVSKEESWQLVLPISHTSYCYCGVSGSKIFSKGSKCSNITKELSPHSDSLSFVASSGLSWAALSSCLPSFLPSLLHSFLFSLLIHSREWNRRRRSSWTQLILASSMGGGGDVKDNTASRYEMNLE